MTLIVVPAILKDISGTPGRVHMSPYRCDGGCCRTSIVSVIDIYKEDRGLGGSRQIPWLNLCSLCSENLGMLLAIKRTWSAFCMTWVTIAWAMLVGKD